ncbi:hypothetical protein [Mesorhizobium sp. WSM2239]|uniref:Uncharacterized protein n=2 Tax=unclassified Mesorhizobium TaxID=325217 RepID=A0AAU8D7E7_9HYPH
MGIKVGSDADGVVHHRLVYVIVGVNIDAAEQAHERARLRSHIGSVPVEMFTD